jgi:hypothetical protein
VWLVDQDSLGSGSKDRRSRRYGRRWARQSTELA